MCCLTARLKYFLELLSSLFHALCGRKIAQVSAERLRQFMVRFSVFLLLVLLDQISVAQLLRNPFSFTLVFREFCRVGTAALSEVAGWRGHSCLPCVVTSCRRVDVWLLLLQLLLMRRA